MTQKTYLGNPRLNKHSEKLLLFWHTVFLIIIMSSHTIKGLLKLWPIFTLSKNGVYSSLTKKHDWPSDELNSSLHNGLCHLIHQKYKLSVSLLLFFFLNLKVGMYETLMTWNFACMRLVWSQTWFILPANANANAIRILKSQKSQWIIQKS